MTTCDAHLRPFPNDTELSCDVNVPEHTKHRSTLRDYAYPGSKTVIEWHEGDRRCYHGEWPGVCGGYPLCVLPLGHPGRHEP